MTTIHCSHSIGPGSKQIVSPAPVLVLEAVLWLSAIQTTTAQTLPSVPPSNLAAMFHPEKLAEMDGAVNQAVAEGNCPGAVVWLERNGVSYGKAYGKRALVPVAEPTTEDTIFDVASLTKDVACTPPGMLLVERERIKLDEPVHAY